MNIQNLTVKFEEAYINKESVTDVNIQLYCDGYEELIIFLRNLGSIFTFVVQDVESKVKILRTLVDKDSESFQTLNSMITTEYSSLKSRNNSGCRTFLRLHRALKFLYLLFEGLVEDDERTLKEIVNKSYDQALAPFHPWYIRKGVKVAVNFLPYKETFLESVMKDQPVDDDLNSKEAYQIFMKTRTIPILKNTFNCCEDYYTKNNLHDLP